MILVHYIQSIKYPIFKVSLEFQGVKVHQIRRQKSSFRDNVFGIKVVGKNGFTVDCISTDGLL